MKRAAAPADMPLGKILALIGFQTGAFALIGWSLWALSHDTSLPFISFALWEIGYGLALGGALIVASATLAAISPALMEKLVRAQAGTYPFLKDRLSLGPIVFLSLCAGIGEEALFRGGLQTWLGDYVPYPYPVLLAALAFALIHFAKPLISALIFAIGCLFGVIYWATGSLLTVMIGHAVYDIYAIWALQEAFHRLGVFAQTSPDVSPAASPAASLNADLPEGSARETLSIKHETTGEDS